MKALRIARRELGDFLGDRSFVLGLIALIGVPLLLVQIPGGRLPGAVLLIFAVQSALFPSFMTVNVAASAFIQDKENQTLLPLLAAPISDSQIVVGKLAAIMIPATAASWIALGIYYVAASNRFGGAFVASILTPGILYAIAVLAALLVMTLGSWSLVIASRVSTVRAAQQLSGLLIAGLYAAFAFAAQFIFDAFGGALFIALPLGLLAADVVALELARRLWGREEVIART